MRPVTKFLSAHLPIRLAADYEGALPTARQVYSRVLNAEIPAEHINGRWYVVEARLPEIARVLGLIPKAARVSARQQLPTER